jgi:hypothetical protein
MMARKLAALLALLGVVVLFTTWIVCQLWPGQKPVMSPDKVLQWGLVVLVVYAILGLFLAKVGISLIREMMADKRSRDEELRYRARTRYEEALSGEPPPPSSPPAAPAPGGAGAAAAGGGAAPKA